MLITLSEELFNLGFAFCQVFLILNGNRRNYTARELHLKEIVQMLYLRVASFDRKLLMTFSSLNRVQMVSQYSGHSFGYPFMVKNFYVFVILLSFWLFLLHLLCKS